MGPSGTSGRNIPGQAVQLRPSLPLAHPARLSHNKPMSLSIDEIQRQLQEIERQEQNLDVLLKTNQGRRKIQRRLEMRAGDDKIIRACDESLHAFVKQMWPVLEPATKFVDGWPLQAMCAHLEAITKGQIQNLLINVPPGSMKSLLSSVFWPAWEWGPQNMPYQSYVCFSYSSSLTERDNEKFRDLIASPEYQRLWGDRFILKKKGAVKVTSDKTGFKLATSVGGLGTGERGRRVCLDDPHNVKQGESKKIREGTVEWFRTSMLNRLNDMSTSAILVIMQRIHDMDVSGCILSDPESFNFVHLCIQNEIERRAKATIIGWKDPRTKKGQLYWPDRLNADQTAKLKKKMGVYAYAGQYQQRPTPAGGQIISESSWKIWEEAYWPQFDFVVASLDSAHTEKEENDPSGFTVWGVFRDEKTRQPMAMLMYSFSEHLQLHDLVTRVADLCTRMHVDRLLIEAKANGHDVYNEMQRLFSRVVACQLVTPKGDKVSRAHAVAYLFDDGVVGYPKGKEYAVKVVDELARLPKGEHDDLCDSATQALKFMRDCGWLLTMDEGTGETEQYRYGKALQDELEPVYDV